MEGCDNVAPCVSCRFSARRDAVLDMVADLGEPGRGLGGGSRVRLGACVRAIPDGFEAGLSTAGLLRQE